MNQETLDKMRQMHLLGMYNAFKTSMESFKTESMTTDQFVAWLVSNEWDDRCNRMIERLIKQASFRYKASLEEVDYSLERGLERNLLERLAELSFVKESRDLFITGSSGTGKSYIATALGYRACQKGMKVLYANTARLMGQLKMAKAKGTISQELKKIERADLLVLDDFGIQPFDAGGRMNLMDIVEDRHGKKSRLITSQVPVKDWYDIIGEKTIADAVLDRIVHQAIRIELNRELDVLKNSLDDMIEILNPGGRLCIITFHSLEDRIVKSAFKKNENPCTCPPDFPVCVCGKVSKGCVVTRKPILPSEEELEYNSRSKSAKLRIFERR